MRRGKINNINFWYRENTSDLKAFEEVIGKNVYQKKGMKILPNEKWIDCGGNVGAFVLLACSIGAEVDVYEPDPFNCEMIFKNLALNGYTANIINAALVHDDTTKANLYAGLNGNYWRNSLVKKWGKQGIKVDCLNFDKTIPDGVCVKMDIEGAEMPILEATERKFSKMVFEWSFDIDPSLQRFWDIIEVLKTNYIIAELGNTARIKTKDYNVWQKSWFPACANVYCYGKD